jgi:hypothetical protein
MAFYWNSDAVQTSLKVLAARMIDTKECDNAASLPLVHDKDQHFAEEISRRSSITAKFM